MQWQKEYIKFIENHNGMQKLIFSGVASKAITIHWIRTSSTQEFLRLLNKNHKINTSFNLIIFHFYIRDNKNII